MLTREPPLGLVRRFTGQAPSSHAGVPVTVEMRERSAARRQQLLPGRVYEQWLLDPDNRRPPGERRRPAAWPSPAVSSIRALSLSAFADAFRNPRRPPLSYLTALRDVSFRDDALRLPDRGRRLPASLLPVGLRTLTLRAGQRMRRSADVRPAELEGLRGLTQLTRLTLEGYNCWMLRGRSEVPLPLPASLKVRSARTVMRAMCSAVNHGSFWSAKMGTGRRMSACERIGLCGTDFGTPGARILARLY